MDSLPLRALWFRADDGPTTKFGPWAVDLVRLGQALSAFDSTSPITLAISLPTRDLAGPLIAAGYIAARSGDRPRNETAGGDGDSGKSSLFGHLCTLSAGTPVRLRQQTGKVVQAVLDGRRMAHGKEWVVVRFQKASQGSGRELIGEGQVDRVLFDPEIDVSNVEQQVGKEIKLRLGLASAFLSDAAALHRHVLRQRADCAFVGTVNRVKEELLSIKLRARTYNGEVVDGTLQDVLRVSNLLPVTESSRGKIFPASGEQRILADYDPALAVFNTASAYVNRSPGVRAAHHAVVLTPTEPNYEMAVAALNDAFLSRLKELSGGDWAVPTGVPAMAFHRRPAESR